MRIVEYNRNLAVKYAEKWASLRNPVYFNFDKIVATAPTSFRNVFLQGVLK